MPSVKSRHNHLSVRQTTAQRDCKQCIVFSSDSKRDEHIFSNYTQLLISNISYAQALNSCIIIGLYDIKVNQLCQNVKNFCKN